METERKYIFNSPAEALLSSVSVAAAWAFYIISWFLERPFVLSIIRKWVDRYKKLEGKELESVLSGIHIRLVGNIFNSVQIVLSLSALSNSTLWDNSVHGVTLLSQLVTSIACGFFIWDFIVSVRRIKQDGAEFILHGSFCMLFYLHECITQTFHFFAVGFVLWELSTPFVHLRWLLYKLGYKDSSIYLFNGVAMIVTFALCRIVWGAFLGIKFFILSLQPDMPISREVIWGLYVLCLSLNGLNWYWFSLMMNYALRRFLGGGQVGQKLQEKKQN